MELGHIPQLQLTSLTSLPTAGCITITVAGSGQFTPNKDFYLRQHPSLQTPSQCYHWPNIPILRGPETGLRQQLLGIFGIWQAVSAAASSGAFRPCFISCITHITKDITIKIYGQQSAKLIILCKTQGRFGDIWFLAIAHCGNVQVLVSRHDMHSHAPLVSLGWQWSKVRLTCRGPGNRIILLQPTHQNWLTLIINVSSDL